MPGMQQKNEEISNNRKNFPIYILFTRRFFGRLAITIFFIVRYHFIFDLSGVMPGHDEILLNICIAIILSIMWFVYLTRPHEIVVYDERLIFKSLFRSIRIDINSLKSIEDVFWGSLTRFESEKKSVNILPKIKNRYGLFDLIQSLNPKVKIKTQKGVGGTSGEIIRFTLFFICIFLFVPNSCPNLRNNPGFNSSAKADLKNTYTAAQAYFTDEPDGIVTHSILQKYAYVPTEGVILTIISGARHGLRMSATHPKGNKIYEVNAKGEIVFQEKKIKLFK